MTDQKTKVVVTGIGVVSPVGSTLESFWDNLCQGRSGIVAIDRFDASLVPTRVGGLVKDFEVEQFMDPKEARRNDLYTRFAVGAAKMALADAGLSKGAGNPDRFGVVVGTGIGGMETIENQSRTLFERGPRKVSPFMIPSLIANIASGVVGIEVGARGPNFSAVSACASGSHAIGESFHMIRNGRADVMIAGGSEAAITILGYAGFCAMKAMSTGYNDDPVRSSRPFDADRDGFVMGEGSGLLVLESQEHALARGAKIYCEIVGYGASCDAFHITMPDPEGKGLSIALTDSLADADLEPTEVDYVNAHGTSTKYNDKFETLALKKVFGEHAYDFVVSSTKSMTGHLLGAAGGIEAAACCMAIKTGTVPPTINYETPDPDCDLNYSPNEKTVRPISVALSTNLGFGGHNTSVIFKKYN
ncbi:MAG: beta-ketoacyl-ACP synthase II [Puniceicoccaceae bacterium]